MTPAELERYARHFALPGVGVEGQKKLKVSRVLCIGAGGVGSPVLTYLAAAGVGYIAVMDGDSVESSNLQRQILFTEKDIGESKAVVAQKRLQAQNSMIRVQGIDQNLTMENALETIQPFDLVIDGSDNFNTRFLVNDACVELGKPFISASIFQFSAQLALFNLNAHGCYRCLFPKMPGADAVPNCAEAGVFGAVTGLVGTMACSLALNYLLADSMEAVLYQIDARNLSVRSIQLNQNESCLCCRQKTAFPELLMQERQENIKACEFDQVPECNVDELENKLNSGVVLLDVREAWEREMVNIPGKSVHMPLGQLDLDQLDINQAYVVYCKVGVRSYHAAKALRQAGFRAENLAGGIDAWQQAMLVR